MMTTSELRHRWGLNRNIIHSIVTSFKNNIKYKGLLYLDTKEVELFEKNKLHQKKVILKDEYVESSEIKAWLRSKGFSDPKETFRRMIRDKLFVKQIKKGKTYIIPKTEFDDFLANFEPYTILSMDNKPSREIGFRPKGTISIRELSVRWNLASYKSVYKYFETEKLPPPVEFLGIKFVCLKDIEEVENKKDEDQAPVTLEKLLTRLEEQILYYSGHLCTEQMKNLFFDFTTLKLKASHASMRKKSQNVRFYISTFTRYVSKFVFEPSKLTDSEIELMIRQEDTPSNRKEIILDFINYCDSLFDIRRTIKIKYVREDSKKTNLEDTSIYSPEIYFDYVEYVKKLDILIPLSVANPKVANAWLYIIMHLIDGWRGIDIVNTLPRFDLTDTDIDSLDWFSNNRLNIMQATEVINQVRWNVDREIATKNLAILNFYVTPDMIIPFATSTILCELHRRVRKHQMLLGSMSNNVITKATKRMMFKGAEHLLNFESLKMNRSTMTYLFYATIEADDPSPDLALELAQRLRSHKTVSSTEIYLHNSNKDGSINKVSLNVFRRGHFGWLYNYILKMAFDSETTSLSYRRRTELIEDLRDEFKPYDIEAWGNFIHEKNQQEQSVLLTLVKHTKQDFIALIKNIMAGKMPARNASGQCLIHPHCEYPQRSSSIGCKHFIPQSYVLLEAVTELKRLYNSIKESKSDATLERDSNFFIYILILMNEAYLTFDREYVDSFLPKEEIQTIIADVSPLMKLKPMT